MRRRIVIAAAIIAVGVGVAGAIVAFAFADTDQPKTCAEILADPPEGGWTCYGPMPEVGWAGDPEHSVVVHE